MAKKWTLSQFVSHLKRFRDAEELARHLKKNRVKGKLGAHKSCPIAIYGTRKCGKQISVGAFRIFAIDGEGYNPYLPDAAFAFVRRFDNGAFPELVA